MNNNTSFGTTIVILVLALALGWFINDSVKTDPAPIVYAPQPAQPAVQQPAIQPVIQQPVQAPAQVIIPTTDVQQTMEAYYAAGTQQAAGNSQPPTATPDDPFAHVTPNAGVQTCEGLSCVVTPNAGGNP